MSRSVHVELAGQRVALRTDAGDTYVASLAAHVEKTLQGVRGARSRGAQDLILACLRITDELFQLRAEHRRLRRSVHHSTQKLIASIDEQIHRANQR